MIFEIYLIRFSLLFIVIDSIFTVLPFSYICSTYITLIGPSDSPYANKAYDIQVTFDDDFPRRPPQIVFVKQFHTGREMEHPV